MAKLIQLSETSWKQPFKDRKRELPLWSTQKDVAKFCNIQNGTKRYLKIEFEKKYKVNITDFFTITSGTEIAFPKSLQDKVRDIVFNNPESYFIVTVLDVEYDNNTIEGNTTTKSEGEEEGDKILKEHIEFEQTKRNSKIVKLKKDLAIKEGKGKIKCECCNFDFLKKYGEIGKGFIECHHKIHVAKGKRLTTLQDLALVCSNCHRMLHRKDKKNKYLTVDNLKKQLAK